MHKIEKKNIRTLEVEDKVLRIYTPPGEGPHPVILMLHGWTGNEKSMWQFASNLPRNAMLVSPRGFFKSSFRGFGWHTDRTDGWPEVEDFEQAVASLIKILHPDLHPKANLDKLNILGFSQGAALAYTFGFIYPHLVNNLAGLSGFLPGGISSLVEKQRLNALCAFIAHGTRDKIIPVKLAREAAETIRLAGAQVTYCEDDVGHKLSVHCFNGLKSFFSKIEDPVS